MCRSGFNAQLKYLSVIMTGVNIFIKQLCQTPLLERKTAALKLLITLIDVFYVILNSKHIGNSCQT